MSTPSPHQAFRYFLKTYRSQIKMEPELHQITEEEFASVYEKITSKEDNADCCFEDYIKDIYLMLMRPKFDRIKYRPAAFGSFSSFKTSVPHDEFHLKFVQTWRSYIQNLIDTGMNEYCVEYEHQCFCLDIMDSIVQRKVYTILVEDGVIEI